ncbi:hypothetical protein PSP6_10019 [Paraburkholderia tropica]|nr:hypothetical protein PSP6_10019 [Paraburkholderia tropica]
MRGREGEQRGRCTKNAARKTKGLPDQEGPSKGGAAGRIRTHDPLVRSQVLYPTELQPHAKTILLTAVLLEICAIKLTQNSEKVARLAGFEPTTPWFVAKYSIQLSYSRTQKREYSTDFGKWKPLIAICLQTRFVYPEGWGRSAGRAVSRNLRGIEAGVSVQQRIERIEPS